MAHIGLRIVMGPFSVYNIDNVEAAANPGGDMMEMTEEPMATEEA